MSKKLKIRIYKDGTMKAKTEGIKGEKCTEYVERLEDLLDAKVINSEFTYEYYEEEVYEKDNIKMNL